MKTWRTHTPAVALLMAIPCALFAPAFLRDQLLYGWDSAGTLIFWRPWLYGWLTQGTLPFFNPDLLGGYPLFLDPQQASLYAVNWVNAVLPPHTALNTATLAHTIWAGWGAYGAARALGAHRLPALCAGLCWQCANLYMGQVLLGTVVHHSTLSWAGWTLLSTELLLRQPDTRRAAWWALAFGGAFYAGHTPFAIYQGYVCAVYGTARLFADPTLRRPALGRGVVTAGALLGLLLTAQVLMVWHLKDLSPRGSGVLGLEDNSSAVVLNLLSWFMPTLYGEEGHRYYWGLGFMNMWMPFVGLWWPWLWLSHYRRAASHPTAGPVMVALVFTLVLAPGYPHLPAMLGFDALPTLSFFRAPVRWWALSSLLMVVGGAVLWSRLRENGGLQLRKGWLALPMAVLVVGVVLWWFPGAVPRFLDYHFMGEELPTVAAIRPVYPGTLLAQVPRDLLSAGGGCLGLMVLTLGLLRLRGKPGQWALAAAVSVPVVLTGSRFLLPVPKDAYALPAETVRALRTTLGQDGRYAALLPAMGSHLPPWVRENYWWAGRYAQQAINGGLPHRLPNAQGYVSLPYSRYLELMLGRHPETGLPNEFDWNFFRDGDLLNLAGVRAVLMPTVPPSLTEQPAWCNPKMYGEINTRIHPAGQSFDGYTFCTRTPGGGLSDLVPIHQDDRFRVLWNDDAFPPAWPVRHTVAAPGNTTLVETLSHRRNLRETAVTVQERAPPLPPDTGPLSPEEHVTYHRGTTPNTFSLTTHLTRERLVAMSLSHDPAWRAVLDGRPAALYRVDHAFTGLVAPAGEHTVTFHYRPTPAVVGLTITTAAFFILVALALRPPRRSYTGGAPQGATP